MRHLSPTMRGVTLNGRVLFVNSGVFLAGFYELRRTDNGRLEFDRRCTLKYCAWDRDYISEKLMIFHPSCDKYDSGLLR